MKTAVIIPTYNERENIKTLVPKILVVYREEAIDGTVIIVDDASPDGTGEVAKELAHNSNMVFVLKRSRKMGLGSAYKDGFKYALSMGCDVVIQMDADFSHNPTKIPKFIKKLVMGCDLVIGSRYIPGGDISTWSFSRRVISNLANRVSRFFLNLTPKDATSGYRAYNSNALKKINFSSIKSDGYAFQIEIVMQCQKAGLKICEIPITFINRGHGKSKLNKMEMWKYLKTIIRLIFAGNG